jgi:hypothetical protein
MGERRNFKTLVFPRNQLQICYGYLCDLCPLTAFIFSDLNYKIVIFLSQTESTTKHIFRKKALSASNGRSAPYVATTVVDDSGTAQSSKQRC